MANQDVSILLRLVDRFTPAAHKIKSATGRMSRAFGIMRERSKAASKSMHKFTRVAHKLSFRVGLPMAALGFTAIKTAATYEKSLNAIRAVLKLTAKEMAEVDAHIIKTSSVSIFTADQTAEAFLNLGRQGMNAAQGMDALNPVLVMAEANMMPMADAARVISNAMSQYSLESKEAMRITDLYTSAVNSGVIGMNDLRQSMARVGQTAKDQGRDLEDVLALVVAIVQGGESPSKTGTGLNVGLRRLGKVDEVGLKNLKAKGITIRDATGHFVKLRAVLEQMKKLKWFDPTNIEGTKALEDLFGEATPRMRALAAHLADVAKNTAKMKKDVLARSAFKQAQNQIKGLTGSLKMLKAAYETASIAVVDQETLDSMTRGVKSVSHAFLELADSAPWVKQLIAIFVVLTAVLAPLVLVVAGVAFVAGVLGIAMFPLIGWSLLVVGGLTLLVFILMRLDKVGSAVVNFFKFLWGMLIKFGTWLAKATGVTWLLKTLSAMMGKTATIKVEGEKALGRRHIRSGDVLSTIDMTSLVTGGNTTSNVNMQMDINDPSRVVKSVNATGDSAMNFNLGSSLVSAGAGGAYVGPPVE